MAQQERTYRQRLSAADLLKVVWITLFTTIEPPRVRTDGFGGPGPTYQRLLLIPILYSFGIESFIARPRVGIFFVVVAIASCSLSCGLAVRFQPAFSGFHYFGRPIPNYFRSGELLLASQTESSRFLIGVTSRCMIWQPERA